VQDDAMARRQERFEQRDGVGADPLPRARTVERGNVTVVDEAAPGLFELVEPRFGLARQLIGAFEHRDDVTPHRPKAIGDEGVVSGFHCSWLWSIHWPLPGLLRCSRRRLIRRHVSQ
jgi:hypothetical protein